MCCWRVLGTPGVILGWGGDTGSVRVSEWRQKCTWAAWQHWRRVLEEVLGTEDEVTGDGIQSLGAHGDTGRENLGMLRWLTGEIVDTGSE